MVSNRRPEHLQADHFPEVDANPQMAPTTLRLLSVHRSEDQRSLSHFGRLLKGCGCCVARNSNVVYVFLLSSSPKVSQKRTSSTPRLSLKASGQKEVCSDVLATMRPSRRTRTHSSALKRGPACTMDFCIS